jgi:choline dehydrogenase-like flavoprotein
VLKPFQPRTIAADTQLECDVVIIGSGAGSGIVAVELAAAGHDVVVLERGPYLNESDFSQRELEMLSRGGMSSSLCAGLNRHGEVNERVIR